MRPFDNIAMMFRNSSLVVWAPDERPYMVEPIKFRRGRVPIAYTNNLKKRNGRMISAPTW